MKKFTRKQKIFLFIVLFTYIFMLTKCKYSLQNCDGRFHARRMYDVFLSIKYGYLFSFLSKDLLNGFGYPTLGMYPYLLMIPFSLLQFFFSTETTYMVYILFLLLLSFFTSYLYASGNNINNIFPIFYILNPYLILIINFSWAGILAAYSILPLVFLSIDKILNNKKNGTVILIISMTLISYSHILSTVILTVVLFIYVGMNYKKITKTVIKKIIISIVACTCLCSFIIFPALEFLLQGKHGMDILGYRGNHIIQIRFNIFYRIMLFLVTAILIKRKKNLETAAILLLSMCTNIFPWPEIILKTIQSGNRMLLFSGIVFGLLLCKIKVDKLYTLFIITPIIILICLLRIHQDEVIYTINNPTNMYINYVSSFDYAPKEFSNSFPIDTKKREKDAYEIFYKDKVLSLNDGQYEIYENSIIFCNHHSRYITLPRLFYKGYKVKLNGVEIENYEGIYGMVQIDTCKENGIITIDYVGTLTQKVSRFVSILSFIIFSVFIIAKYTNTFSLHTQKAHRL